MSITLKSYSLWTELNKKSKYLCLNFHLCFPLILTSLRLLWDSEHNLCLNTCQPFFQNSIQPNPDMTPMNVSASSAFYSTWIYHHTWHAATHCGEQTVMLIFVLIILLWYIILKIDKSILSTATNFINLIITWYLKLKIKMNIYRMSQEERAKLREGVPYVKLYRYNPKHLYPKLNGYGDNGQRKVWSS
jgi:hypothetical protein